LSKDSDLDLDLEADGLAGSLSRNSVIQSTRAMPSIAIYKQSIYNIQGHLLDGRGQRWCPTYQRDLIHYSENTLYAYVTVTDNRDVTSSYA